MMIVSGITSLSIVLLKDHLAFEKLKNCLCTKAQEPSNDVSFDMDDDVRTEVERIRGMSQEEISEGNLILSGVSKEYKKFRAVNQMHLAVSRSECFGLLGNNVRKSN